MKPRTTPAITTAALVFSALAVAAPVTAAAETPDATVSATDPVIEWNRHATDALIVTAQQPPQQAVLHLAMVHGAVYDAVNAIDRGHDGYLLAARIGQRGDSLEAAAATAAYRILERLVPTQQPTLDERYATSLAAVQDGVAKSRGVAVGEAAAAAMIAARTGDGRYGAPGFATGAAPGVWRPVLPAFANDPNAWLQDVRPFLVADAEQFQSKGPRALTSRQYAREFDEVKVLGSAASPVRTADQTAAAQYWNASPHGTWSRIVRTIAEQQALSLVDNARLFAVVYTSAADALITTWNDKGQRLFWRPVTAIREADTDGNPRTTPDPTWVPLIATPPYPEHPSGLASLTGATTTALREFFGTDAVAWSDTNGAGVTRSFARLSDARREVIDARVWSGVHFRTADVQGDLIGHQVARWGARHYFRPVAGSS